MLRDIAAALEARGGKSVGGGREISCRCPFHDDSHNSFSFNRESGAFQCHVPGCVAHGTHGMGVARLAEALNIRTETPSPKPRQRSAQGGLGEPTAIYCYHDEQGNEVQQVLRFESGGGKTFRQRHRGRADEWVWRSAPVQYPYKLQALLPALQSDQSIVFIVEGEKDADRLAQAGLIATCNAMGAGKWTAEHAKWFRGATAKVVIIPDNDAAGMKHAQGVYQTLRDVGISPVILRLAVDAKQDVSDWLDAGNTADALCELARSAKPSGLPDAADGERSMGAVRSIVELEQSVLGAWMLIANAYYDFPLPLSDFSVGDHREVYKAIANAVAEGDRPNKVTVAAQLNRMGILDSIGGVEWLSKVIFNAAMADELRVRVAQLRDAASARRTRALARSIEALAVDASLSAADRNAAIDKAYAEFLGRTPQSGGLRHVSDLLAEFTLSVEDTANGKQRRFTVGIPEFDSNVVLEPHRLVIAAGRPGMGKTAWLLYMARSIARSGASVAFYSLEMNGFQTLRRATAAESQMEAQRIGAPDMTADEWASFMSALGALSQYNIWLSDSPNIDVATIAAECRRLKQQRGLDVIIIDYIGLLRKPRAENEVVALGELARQLKVLAGDLDCLVIAAAQLNRQVEERSDKRPQLSDLRASGTLEEHADTVLMLYRDAYYNAAADGRRMDIIVRKQRDGQLTTVQLGIDLARATFYPYRTPTRIDLT